MTDEEAQAQFTLARIVAHILEKYGSPIRVEPVEAVSAVFLRTWIASDGSINAELVSPLDVIGGRGKLN